MSGYFKLPEDRLYDKVKLLISKKIESSKEITYDEVFELLFDKDNGEINKSIRGVKELESVNNAIKALMGEDINIIYKQIYK